MAADFDKMRRQLMMGSRLEVVLRGHLWAETLINGAIESALTCPDALRLDRMSFSAKLSLAHALGVLAADDVRWFHTLNKMRNRLAHDLDGEPTNNEIEGLVMVLSGDARALFDGAVENYSGGNARLVLAFTVQLVRLEYARRLRTYEAEHGDALKHYRTQAALHRMAGTEMTEEKGRQLRENWNLPEPPTVWDVVGRPDPDRQRVTDS